MSSLLTETTTIIIKINIIIINNCYNKIPGRLLQKRHNLHPLKKDSTESNTERASHQKTTKRKNLPIQSERHDRKPIGKLMGENIQNISLILNTCTLIKTKNYQKLTCTAVRMIIVSLKKTTKSQKKNYTSAVTPINDLYDDRFFLKIHLCLLQTFNYVQRNGLLSVTQRKGLISSSVILFDCL